MKKQYTVTVHMPEELLRKMLYLNLYFSFPF